MNFASSSATYPPTHQLEEQFLPLPGYFALYRTISPCEALSVGTQHQQTVYGQLHHNLLHSLKFIARSDSFFIGFTELQWLRHLVEQALSHKI